MSTRKQQNTLQLTTIRKIAVHTETIRMKAERLKPQNEFFHNKFSFQKLYLRNERKGGGGGGGVKYAFSESSFQELLKINV